MPSHHGGVVPRWKKTIGEVLPGPLLALPADALLAVARHHDVLAALARERAEFEQKRERDFGKPSLRFSKTVLAAQRRALETIERDRQVMKLARAGRSNAFIASRVGLHPVTVSKIIRRTLKGDG